MTGVFAIMTKQILRSRIVSVGKVKRVEVFRSARSMATGQGVKMVEAWYFVVGAIGTYMITSIFFLKWPIIYKKKRLSFKCAHISHRGGELQVLLSYVEHRYVYCFLRLIL